MGQHAPCSNTRGVVLAGVHRWRDSVLERAVPRPLLPIANRPLIEHVLSWLEDVGALSVGLCANSDTVALRHNLGGSESRRFDLHYYEDHMPRGPAGCVRDAAIDLVDGPLVVVEGTILPEAVDLGRLLDTHARSNAAMTVVVDGSRRSEGRSAWS